MEYRLNKYISGSGYCSRREADRLIEEGQVTINGKRASIGMRVLPGQKVRVHGELIVNDIEPLYIAFNKPMGVVSTTDPNERDNIVDFISHEQRIFPIGRLDKDSQGLILLTNDGDIVNKILRVGNNHKKKYIVKVDRPIAKEFITKMSQGVPILDRVTRRCEVVQINPFTFEITLIQGLNRQIRRMCEYFNYEVLKLERVQVMNIKLGSLGQGNWRPLTDVEMEGLLDLLEESKSVAESKKVVNSNKAMNRVLEEYDKKTNYRKATSVAKLQKQAEARRPKPSSDDNIEDDFIEDKPKAQKKKNTVAKGTGQRLGKSKASKTKTAKPKRPVSSKRNPPKK